MWDLSVGRLKKVNVRLKDYYREISDSAKKMAEVHGNQQNTDESDNRFKSFLRYLTYVNRDIYILPQQQSPVQDHQHPQKVVR